MVLKFNSIKCPECKATLPIEENRTKIFCSYCGSLIVVTNENEYVYRHIDEAKIKQAETSQTIQLKKLEIIEKNRVLDENIKKLKIYASVLIGSLGVLLLLGGLIFEDLSLVGMLLLVVVMYIWIFDGISKTPKNISIDIEDKIQVPTSINGYKYKNYIEIENAFLSAGFTNVICRPLHDLATGWITKPNTVESIKINNQLITSGGQRKSAESEIIISYHSF